MSSYIEYFISDCVTQEMEIEECEGEEDTDGNELIKEVILCDAAIIIGWECIK